MIELPVIESIAVPESQTGPSGTTFWRSVSDLKGTEDFRELASKELLPGADTGPAAATRRQFIQIMGASMALAGLTGCRRPVEKILPFSRKPEDMIPGVPMYYATGMPLLGSVSPLLVESSDGRPTKIEGNPDHPHVNGSSGVFEQAALLNLYDPDRSRDVLRDGGAGNWSDFVSAMTSLPANARIGIIAPPTSSMTIAGLRTALTAKFREVRWVEYASTGNDTSRIGATRAFGSPVRPIYRLGNARVIVSLDADFLAPTNPDMLGNTKGFAQSRAVDDGQTMSRLYVVESQYSITGGMADNRLRIRSSSIPAFTAALASAMGIPVSGGSQYSGHTFVTEIASDLLEAGSTGVVIAGEGQSVEVHALAAAINEKTGAAGSTILYQEIDASAPVDRMGDLASLVEAVSDGLLDAIVIIDCNPVYDIPADIDLAGALAAVSESVHVGPHVDETASVCRWHIPAAHFLEAWGDGRSFDGTMSVIQPLIAPLYPAARSDIEILALLAAGRETPGYELVRDTWKNLLSGNFESRWRRILHDGFLPDSAYEAVSPTLVSGGIPSSVTPAEDADLEVVVRLDSKVLDGSFANNAWMQELPDPATKIVWDNVAVMSPATAEALGLSMHLKSGANYSDTITLTVDSRSVELPVWVQPGTADGSIGVQLGYGRQIASKRPERASTFFDLDHYTDIYGHGALATGVGTNVAPLRTSSSTSILTGATVTKSGSGYMIATTQDHGALPVEGLEVEKRGVFRMATVDEYRVNPYFIRDHEPAPVREDWSEYPTLWENRHPRDAAEFKSNDYFQYQWGMTIDLNTCTGCNACTVACQAENNIQVVGKEEVSRGREMSWIRLDRYFVSGDGGSFEDPRMVIQPLACMMCENAPCEEVCPVAATVHSSDGMNTMIYNRCIGTRYCSNNCPYKVRRFNYYNWTKTLPESTKMAQNPNVTVRSRGVMEKCSYCIQRIREVNKRVSLEKRKIIEGEVVTACQQACPAKAITFGNLVDPESAVSRTRKSTRRYEMLAELNVLPRTSYLGRIRNPNPRLESNA